MVIPDVSAAIFYEDPSVAAKAERWAQFLGCELNPSKPVHDSNRLYFAPGEVLLTDSQGRKLRIDFDKDHLNYDRSHRGKNELLAKALGAAKGIETVLDLSVGLAIDSIFLTRLGFKVSGVERAPLLYVLLKEAFERTSDEQLQKYELHFDDASDFLRTNMRPVDAIYFDPMYPHKKKSALPKQEMVLFRDLVGNDDDAGEVLDLALTWDCQRVVVKRPINAEPLRPGVLHHYEGKLVRYDVYRKATK